MIFVKKLIKPFIEVVWFVGYFILNVLKAFFQHPIFFKQILIDMYRFGYKSILIVGLTGFLAGGVIVLQAYKSFSVFDPETSMPMLIAISVIRELGPTLSGLMISARVSSSIAAEISNMAFNGYFDIFKSLKINVFGFLVKTKIVAMSISSIFLNIICSTMGVLGGLIACVSVIGMNQNVVVRNLYIAISKSDIFSGMIKTFCFFLSACVISCFFGFRAANNKYGVADATINGVVWSSISVLIINYLLTYLMF